MNISALVQAHNEAACLGGCLKSLAWADELVVADHASTDATRAIALVAGARVLDLPALGFVEPTRQKAISQCQGEWVILLDADERMPPPLAEQLKVLSQQASQAAFWLPRRNYFLGEWLEHGCWPDYQLRFFRRACINWPELVHEHPRVEGATSFLPADPSKAIEHPGYGDSLERYIFKLTRCAPIDADRLAQTLRPPIWPYLLRRPGGEFYGRYIGEQAWRHGMHGLVWALLQATYQLEVAMHYWAKNSPGPGQTPESGRLRRQLRWEALRQMVKWLNPSRGR